LVDPTSGKYREGGKTGEWEGFEEGLTIIQEKKIIDEIGGIKTG